jgi:hypothetical protein
MLVLLVGFKPIKKCEILHAANVSAPIAQLELLNLTLAKAILFTSGNSVKFSKLMNCVLSFGHSWGLGAVICHTL